MHAADGFEQAAIAAVAAGERERLKQARHATRQGWTQKRASAAPSLHSNARFAEKCRSIPSKMIALFRTNWPVKIPILKLNTGHANASEFIPRDSFRAPIKYFHVPAHLAVFKGLRWPDVAANGQHVALSLAGRTICTTSPPRPTNVGGADQVYDGRIDANC